ncbi:hypothetical protein [Pyxidicoccus trucidator]|uniref:hypothetical protein n=1 Tax=Pyxidicoccus trucidator TaxID=2709662 RepID=UPI001967C911|nr:hypothetical protein [Pyxidicoccus trucidator]
MRHTFIFATVLLTASVASARDDDRGGRDGRDGYHEHDGFFLRLQLGGGYTRAGVLGEDLALKGGGGSINVEFGGAPVRNLILFGKLFGASSPNPDIEVGDLTIEGQDEDVSQNYGGLGVGIAYYLMPANVYLSGALTASRLTIDEDGETFAETDLGPGFHLGIGKEWWVSKNWGLGLGAELALGRVAEKDESAKWNVVSGNLFLTATFN